MILYDCTGQAEAEARTWLRPAHLQSDEALGYPLAVGRLRNAGAIVVHRQPYLVARFAQRHGYRRRLPLPGAVFDRIVDDIGQRLRQQFAVTGYADRLGRLLSAERNAGVFRHRLVKFDHIVDGLRHVDR